MIACLFVACTENTKQNAIPTENGTVADNGGMAVSYGNYVYFINGFAGESALNTFGSVVRGAICRVTLKNGVPDYKTVTTVVPKNVFGEDTTYGGIYIVDGYIYYNTTSVDKDSDLNYKTSQGVLCRTSLDGTKTDVIKELDDNDIKIYAGDNSKYLVYVYDNAIYSLNSKTLETKILTKSKLDNSDNTAVAYTFVDDYAIFTMYNYADTPNYSSDYLVYVYNLVTGELSEVMSSDIYNGNTDRKVLYTTTIVSANVTNDKLNIFYSKKDNTPNQANTGYYSYSFSANDMTFDASKEVRYSYENEIVTYTNFYTLDNNGYVLAYGNNVIDVYLADGTQLEKTSYDAVNEGKYVNFDFSAASSSSSSDNSSSSITLIDVIETAEEVYVNFISNSIFSYVKLFNKSTSGNITTYIPADENKIDFFSGKYNTSYVSYDVIDNVIYYFNDDMEDNAYYYAIPTLSEITPDTDIATGKILGIISEQDLITLIGEEQTETKTETK